jgi:hypothetical protein
VFPRLPHFLCNLLVMRFEQVQCSKILLYLTTNGLSKRVVTVYEQTNGGWGYLDTLRGRMRGSNWSLQYQK